LFQHERPLSRRAHQHAAIAALRFFSEIVEKRGTGCDFSARLAKRFALLGGHEDCNILGPFANQIRDPVQYFCPFADFDHAPMCKAFRGSFKCLIKICCRCQG
jgi:hypothetical protein